MSEPKPTQRTGPHFAVLVGLLLAMVGYGLMLSVANAVEQGHHSTISATAGPHDPLNPVYMLMPQAGLALTFATIIWSFLPGRRGFSYVVAVGAILLAVPALGLGIYLWLWAGQIFSAGW